MLIQVLQINILKQPPLKYKIKSGYCIVIPIFKSTSWNHDQKLSFTTALLKIFPSEKGAFKETVSRDFLLQDFFMNHLPPSP
jgi:hypothetical protein